nr:MAG TPA: REGULATORY PROTEIN E2-1, E2, DNA-binding domain, DNA.5A [Caudoviricetes sp.]
MQSFYVPFRSAHLLILTSPPHPLKEFQYRLRSKLRSS